MKTYKTTNKDFSEFKKWVKYYLDLYELNSFTVYFRHTNIRGVARTSVRSVARGVTFTLAKDSKCYNKKELNIRETAKHEVCHVLISDLSNLVGTFCTEDQAEKSELTKAYEFGKKIGFNDCLLQVKNILHD